MKKKLNESAITNELKGSVYFQKSGERSSETVASANDDKLVAQSTIQSTDESIDRPTGLSTNQSTKSSITPLDTSPVVRRPKAFYLTEKQDEDLDVVVDLLTKKLGDRVNQKIDRSTVMRLLLESADLTADDTIQRLADHMVARLITQLRDRSTGGSTGESTN